jgi:hypothetical protein
LQIFDFPGPLNEWAGADGLASCYSFMAGASNFDLIQKYWEVVLMKGLDGIMF